LFIFRFYASSTSHENISRITVDYFSILLTAIEDNYSNFSGPSSHLCTKGPIYRACFFFSDFEVILIFWADFSKEVHYKVPRKYVRCEWSCYMRKDRHDVVCSRFSANPAQEPKNTYTTASINILCTLSFAQEVSIRWHMTYESEKTPSKDEN